MHVSFDEKARDPGKINFRDRPWRAYLGIYMLLKFGSSRKRGHLFID